MNSKIKLMTAIHQHKIVNNNILVPLKNNNSQLRVENNVLPEKGEQSNSGLITVIASVLLAVGSLLTFKNF